jgi:hypothetical protein
MKLPQRGIVLKFLTGTTRGIVMQLILGCNSNTTVMFLKRKKDSFKIGIDHASHLLLHKNMAL